MADWDADSDQLRDNLQRLLVRIRHQAIRRVMPTVEAARRWHRDMMHGLTVPDSGYVGRFRGETGLEDCEVGIGTFLGSAAADVANDLGTFETRLERATIELDLLIPLRSDLDVDTLAAVIDLCAWTHAIWIRIHPFANGNGRTARLWANSIAMRYDLPPFVRLRPRPEDGYGEAAAAAMDGRWIATVPVFRRMLRETLSSGAS